MATSDRSSGPAPAAGPGRRRSLVDWLEARFHLTETFSFLTSFGIFPLELDNRLPLRAALEEAKRRPMPSYMRFPRVLGLLAVQLFFFLGITGAMLAFYYRPTVSEAHPAMTTIVRDVHFGWLVQQSHRWAALALVVILVLRVIRFFFDGLHYAPREGLWMIGVLILTTAGLADLTGRLLPLDGGGYWSTVRGVEVLERIPGIGSLFVFLLGGTRFDSILLIRAYVLHLLWLPAAMLLLFHLNLVGLRRVGLSTGGGELRPGGTYRKYVYDLLILSVLVFGGLLTLATLWPQPFGPPVDPYSTPGGVRPPWYLLGAHAWLERLPAVIPEVVRGGLLLLAWLTLLLLPFLERKSWRPRSQRRLTLAVAVLALVAIAWLSWLGYGLETQP